MLNNIWLGDEMKMKKTDFLCCQLYIMSTTKNMHIEMKLTILERCFKHEELWIVGKF